MDNIQHLSEYKEINEIESVFEVKKSKIISKNTPMGERHFIEIKRNIIDDTFSIKSTYFSRNQKKVEFSIQLNNQPLDFSVIKEINEESYENFIIPFLEFKKNTFSDIKTLSLVSSIENKKEDPLIVTQLKLVKNPLLQKDFFVDDSIKFKSVKALRTSSFSNTINDKYQNSYDKLLYNNLVFYPTKLKVGEYNETLFDVVAYNDAYNEELIERDLNLKPKFVENLPIENQEKLNLYFEKNDKVEFINGKKVIGKIKIVDNTYYDFEKKTTVKGINSYSKRGFIIPYNFSGEIFPRIKIDINKDFEDITLSYKQKIKHKFLDKNDGKVKFYISSYKEPRISEVDHYLIKNSQFKFLLDTTITLDGLKKLYKKDEEEIVENKGNSL
ncbi:MHO_1580 family protein [Mycoplasma sp. Z386]